MGGRPGLAVRPAGNMSTSVGLRALCSPGAEQMSSGMGNIIQEPSAGRPSRAEGYTGCSGENFKVRFRGESSGDEV